MINKINEKIYNYIFSVNVEMRNSNELDFKQAEKELNKIISEKYDVIADFWDENMYDFNNDCVIKMKNLGANAPLCRYNNFPRMKSNAKIDFLEFKAEQIKKDIEDNGDFIKENVEKIFDKIKNLGIKEILDYCKEKEIIKYIGNPFVNADDNAAYTIIYDNIKANLSYSKDRKENEDILISGFLIEYTQKQKIQDSANAEIWIVQDEDKNEFIAKILNKNISVEKLKRYRNEVNFCRIYKNEHLIEVIDNGIKNINGKKYMFYIMPKYDGDFRRLMQLKIDHSKILYYFNQILEGIKFIHNKGGFHRDIKPENILYDKNNDLLVISDLGIAHFNEEDLINDPKTKKTSKLANFMYSAPEQRIKGGNVDYRCDIYALGLILNELFTNQIIQGSKYKKISDIDEEFSFLDSIVEKMTAQNPDERYKSIEEIQYVINASIDIYNKQKEKENLKKIQLEQNKNEDILIFEPIKIINIKIDEDYKLIIEFNHTLNELWVKTLIRVDKIEIMGYGPERFEFNQNQAMLYLNRNDIKSAPKIIEYFKKWIESTNKEYPKRVEEEANRKRRVKEEEIKKALIANAELQQIIKEIKI